MLNIAVKTVGLKSVLANLSGAAKQMPFATAKALTDTAKDVRKREQVKMPQEIDRPTRFTLRGLGIQTATKRKLESRVFFKDIQSEYLFWVVEGGLAGKRIQPANIRLNKYGNIPRKSLKRLLARPDVFYGTIRGITGVWQRGIVRGKRFTTEVKASRGPRGQTGYKFRAGNIYRNVRLLAVRDEQVRYKQTFDFYGIAQREVDRRWVKNFDRSLDLALRTAR